MARLRERVIPSQQFESLIGFSSFVFLWPITLICLVQSPYFVYLSVLAYVHTPLLAKIDSTKEAYRKLVSLSITPFLTSKKSFCACVVGEVS